MNEYTELNLNIPHVYFILTKYNSVYYIVVRIFPPIITLFSHPVYIILGLRRE